jgi:hypothetical protein
MDSKMIVIDKDQNTKLKQRKIVCTFLFKLQTTSIETPTYVRSFFQCFG